MGEGSPEEGLNGWAKPGVTNQSTTGLTLAKIKTAGSTSQLSHFKRPLGSTAPFAKDAKEEQQEKEKKHIQERFRRYEETIKKL